MPVVIIVVVMGVIIIQWLNQNPGIALLVYFALAIAAVGYSIHVIKTSRWYQRYREKQKLIEARNAEVIEADNLRQAAAEGLLKSLEEARSLPPREAFGQTLLASYHTSCAPPLAADFLQQLIEAFVLLYAPQTRAQYEAYKAACLTSLVEFTKLVPIVCLQDEVRGSSFEACYDLADLVTITTGKIVALRDEYLKAYYALTAPFKQANKDTLGFLDWSNTYPGAYITELSFEEMPVKERESKRTAAFSEQEKLYPLSIPFTVTALYPHYDKFLPKGILAKPFNISSEARSRHQWIVGAPGAGKTTFISAMIAEDLKKVARNEASIFVMDSQNELIPDIANLEMFAPGRPLHGKLIYLEPDPDFPLSLNIFDTNKARTQGLSSKEKAMMESGAIWMVEFFLSSLVKSEASPHQDTFLNYVIPALMAIPDATIFTFKDLLEGAKAKGGETGYDRYKQHFGGLRQDTQDWLRDRMHSVEMAQTRNAIRARLDGFTARGFFHDMFVQPRNKLDLFEEMQNGKVILVNTAKGLLKNGTEPFGRYFIARLLQAAEERMFVSRGGRLPVYCYIDEASDYIKEEANIEELISKARKQNVALIIANQMESQITSPIVRDALSRVAIQCRGEPGDIGQPPKWEIAIGNREPVQVQVPNVNFANLPKMSNAHYDEMLNDMRKRFSSPAEARPSSQHVQPRFDEVHVPPPTATPTPPAQTPRTELNETDAKPW